MSFVESEVLVPNIAAAQALGAAAFGRGIACKPCDDVKLPAFLGVRQIGDPRSVPELKAWHKGWIDAMLAAPVTFADGSVA